MASSQTSHQNEEDCINYLHSTHSGLMFKLNRPSNVSLYSIQKYRFTQFKILFFVDWNPYYWKRRGGNHKQSKVYFFLTSYRNLKNNSCVYILFFNQTMTDLISNCRGTITPEENINHVRFSLWVLIKIFLIKSHFPFVFIVLHSPIRMKKVSILRIRVLVNLTFRYFFIYSSLCHLFNHHHI